MESLDTTFERMKLFEQSLGRFNDRLAETYRFLAERHDAARDDWQDKFARDYEAAWAPLESGLRQWCTKEGPQYLAVMEEKARLLQRYLDGDW
ncbi:MAG: hypothetical protein ABF479_12175 [Gluconacetobacter sp.]|uniref:Uncharacterized protein n=2 Tax=Gluconacetobacter TaxID=89583 RepID=A0A370FUR9_GLULI|nr:MULTISPECIES: hypothetical protein [Gluconacetobacter]GBR08257.1 hypothetical protein AA0522_2228 [Gluconacetobacter liquefaciens NRIC 0522]MBB2188203.1 hypothetical protein [Gluconacetobacter liquefaciens]MBB2198829.1 hypothetical protein [Gluconacetobacter dulcium]RDI34179.1 hypothetical protein C7453_11641 [Gluconacetobacter liquefaciens]GEB38953.1 hypothetical protein GLI01_29880 [Gluconacetobacter liquefaciens]